MNRGIPKSTALRLNSDKYYELHQKVLRRDGWRCQSCGAMKHLEVHHQQYRSHSGEDNEDNLITLCSKCHKVHHSQREECGDSMVR